MTGDIDSSEGLALPDSCEPGSRIDNSYLDSCYILRLWPLLALGNFHRDFLTFTQGFSAGAVNCAVVYENIFTTFLLNKSKTFFIVEPLNGTSN